MDEDRVQRRLTTILSADVVGYSRLMALDEEATIRFVQQRLDLLNALLPRRTGRLFKTMGDGALVEFESPVEAVRCAIEFQEAVRTQNDQLPDDRHIRFRIGINLGDVVSRDGDLLGDAVNIASRLQQAAPADGICVSNGVFEQLIGKLTVGSHDLGLLAVKNIPRPVHAHVLRVEGASAAESVTPPLTPAPRRRLAWIAAAIALAGAALAGAYGIGPLLERRMPAPPGQPAPAPGPALRELVAEKIPFIRNSTRRKIRDEYVPGPDHKAIAISTNGTGDFVVGRLSAEQARTDAIERCNGRSRSGCAIYAIGNTIVSEQPDPSMPPLPFVRKLPGPVIPLDADRVPLLSGSYKRVLKRQYAESDRPKAAAMSPSGHANFSTDDDGEEAAVRRVLEVCGRQTGTPCRVFAVMDRLVIPVPERFVVRAWLAADQLAFLTAELRGRIARDYETAEEWRALAVATNGRIGIAAGREGELDATEAALKECALAGGSGCEIFAIGPYRVERPTAQQ